MSEWFLAESTNVLDNRLPSIEEGIRLQAQSSFRTGHLVLVALLDGAPELWRHLQSGDPHPKEAYWLLRRKCSHFDVMVEASVRQRDGHLYWERDSRFQWEDGTIGYFSASDGLLNAVTAALAVHKHCANHNAFLDLNWTQQTHARIAIAHNVRAALSLLRPAENIRADQTVIDYNLVDKQTPGGIELLRILEIKIATPTNVNLLRAAG